MVGKGSPKLHMIASGSPKLRRFMPTIATKKKPSPKSSGAKKRVSSPKAKQRADWNPSLEKSLVEVLHDYKEYRGDNDWNSESWNKMVKEFHLRNKYVSYTKTQIQEKEGQLKRDYKMLKVAKEQSGSSWNEKRNMVEGPEFMWNNLMVSFSKIKKFNNNKATFPLFDALGELYDGHLAEGNYNLTSIEASQEEERHQNIHDAEDEQQVFEDDLQVLEVNDEVGDGTERDDEMLQGMAETLSQDEESEAPSIQRSGQQRPSSSKKQEKQLKRPRKNDDMIGMMGSYLEMRTKQAQAEAEEHAREREAREREANEREAKERNAAQASDFSIISVLNTMKVTTEEKAKAYAIFFKSKEHREAFICACEVDQESALLWLKSEMA